jgi:F-type H+-transporting ATPase subunit a
MADTHAAHDPLDPAHLMAHVKDSTYFEVPKLIAADRQLTIPQPFSSRLEQPIIAANPKFHLEAFDLKITKFMVLELVVVVVLILIFVPIAARMTGGKRPRGKFWNFFEAMLVYLRDNVARPAIAHDPHHYHEADKFLPFLWTMFFFVLGCNLVGMLPWSGTPTGALATTSALAILTFFVVLVAGMSNLGPVKFWLNHVPPMDIPGPKPVGWLMKFIIFCLEIMGLLIKHFVLAVRLLANMFAGHLVLAVILAFIAKTAGELIWYGVMPASILGGVALSLLELFVAFLQAYIFTFLSALFIGMGMHEH